VKQNRQLARVVADFLEDAAKEVPPDQADLLRRSAQLMLEQNAVPPPVVKGNESEPKRGPEPEPKPEPKPEPQKEMADVPAKNAPAQEKGVSVLDSLLGIMLTEENVAEKIARAVTERQRQMRRSGLVGEEINVKLKFSRPAGQKVGITMSEDFDVAELKKDLAALRRLGFNCVAGYAC